MNFKASLKLMIVIISLTVSQLHGQSTDWTGTNGSNFFNSNNWTNGVPQQGVNVGFNLPGEFFVSILADAEAGNVNISGGGEPNFIGDGEFVGLTFSIVDCDMSLSGDVTAVEGFLVGDITGTDETTLFVENGACVEVLGSMQIQGDSDVAFVGTDLDAEILNIGHGAEAGFGRFDVVDDARLDTNIVRIGQNASADYTVNLAGSSSWGNTGIMIVGDLGTGKLNVCQGSCVNTDSFVIAARNPSGRGEIRIKDFGTEFVASGNMLIGEDAPSTLEVSNDGLLQVDDLTIASGSTATFDSGLAEMAGDINVNNSFLILENGSSLEVSGIVTIDNGSLTINSSDLQVDEVVNDGFLTTEGTDVVTLENVTNMGNMVIDTDTQVMDLRNDTVIAINSDEGLTVNGDCIATGIFTGAGTVTLLGETFIGSGNQPQDFSVEGTLQLRSNSVVNMRVSSPVSDRIVCGEINIASNSLPTLDLEINNQGNFQDGQEIVLIETDQDIPEEFANLPEGHTEQVGEFTFTATYSGGDGNDLTLIVSGDDEVLLGDINLDGVVNLLDVGPFVDIITSGDFQAEADINEDGEVNLLDVGPFVSILAG